MNMPSAVYYKKVSQKRKKNKIKEPPHEPMQTKSYCCTMNPLLHHEPAAAPCIFMNTARHRVVSSHSSENATLTQAATIHVCTNSARFLSSSCSLVRTHHISSYSTLHHLRNPKQQEKCQVLQRGFHRGEQHQ